MKKNKNNIIIASGNKGKVREIKNIINIDSINLIKKEKTIKVIEDGNSFFKNALKKAKTYSNYFKTAALADDTGLVVDSLGGKPGIHSARFAGKNSTDKKNIDKLLKKLENKKNRNARFITVMVLYCPSGKYFSSKGICEGSITKQNIGENGFGYDPIFKIKNKDKTMAQLTIEEKNKISHRGKAIKKMKKIIKNNFNEIFNNN